MSPELYFAVMLITNPQKARRILLAEELENWFMDLFDDEFEDILNGTFSSKQDEYIDRIVDKYLEMTGVNIINTDSYSRSVIDKAYKSAKEIQEATWRNIVVYPLRKQLQGQTKSLQGQIKSSRRQTTNQTTQSSEQNIANLILGGLAIGTAIYANENINRWLGQERANLIALNEANWKWNNEEYFDAKETKKTKTWHTALDERVRFTHIALEGKKIPIDEYFQVGNSLMMYPLDSSLGADISEIANCRCSVSYGD